jgi:phage repressor protein C with HTH and peptisase S24 domain
MNMTFDARFKKARSHAGLTQGQLAKKISEKTGDQTTQTTISDIETGKQRSATFTATAAHICGVDAVWLETGRGAMLKEGSNVAPAPSDTRVIPVVDYVIAGKWRDVADAYLAGGGFDYITTEKAHGRHSFALEIVGDSMLPRFKPGDRVIIDPDVFPKPGHFVVAKNGGEGATFKKYRPRGVNENGDTVFELVPLNEDHATLRSDREPIEIIGTMVEHRQYIRD